MSHGPGKLQRSILCMLHTKIRHWWPTYEIRNMLPGNADTNIRRALRGLESMGYVKSYSPFPDFHAEQKSWRLTRKGSRLVKDWSDRPTRC
jgi:hypothetical protein